MNKDTQKNYVGQPLFKQVIELIPKNKFYMLVNKLQTDYCSKKFFSWDQLITLLFGIYSRCDSMNEVCDGMRALAGKLNYLGMDIAPAKSTVGDALQNRPEELYRLFFFTLLDHFSPILSDSRKKLYQKSEISFKTFLSFDSTTITLFSEVLKGVSRETKGDGKRKGGLKVHMLTDIHAETPVFANITEARVNDQNFFKYLKLPKDSMVTFDRAYNNYLQFAKWTNEGVNFVTRLKEDASYEIVGEAEFKKKLKEGKSGVYRVEHIHLQYNDPTPYKVEGLKEATFYGRKRTLCLRLVHYIDDKGRYYKFITNNWAIKAEEVALIYKYRWTIETTFKKLKQNFQLTYFYSESENGIKTQVWCTLIAYLLLLVIETISGSKKALSTIAALIRMHLISHLCIFWVVTEGRRAYTKRLKSRNKCPAYIQGNLF